MKRIAFLILITISTSAFCQLLDSSADEMVKEGITLGRMNIKLLQKVEELRFI